MPVLGPYPRTRLRRRRISDWSRLMVRETHLHVSDLIWPLFVHDQGGCVDIASMPGVQRLDEPSLLAACEQAMNLGIPAVALFPCIPAQQKNAQGSEAVNPANLACRSIQAVKARFPDLCVIADVALDPYTDHGQDGVMVDGYVVNDDTNAILVAQALTLAQAGADIVAPSDMMDGRIGQIRDALESEGHINVQLMSYAAKYASAFYGPFRDAVGSAKGKQARSGGKAAYQMDPANIEEAIHEVALDLQEGADSVIVKPALPYLDVITRVKTEFKVPTYAYQVSGEYAMLHAAAQQGWLDLQQVMMESLIGIKRAGADGIWTYAAPVVADAINNS